MMSALLASLAPYLIGLVAALGGLATVFMRGRTAGRKAEAEKHEAERQKALEANRQANRDVAKMSDEEVDAELRKWRF